MLRLNKKGQGASSSETTGWILALIVLVVVALVVWFLFGYFQDTAELAPGDLQKAVAYCDVSPFKNNPSQYCIDYKEFEVDGKAVYYNCADILTLSGSDEIPQKCEGSENQYESIYCTLLVEQGKISVGEEALIGYKKVPCERTQDGSNFNSQDQNSDETEETSEDPAQ